MVIEHRNLINYLLWSDQSFYRHAGGGSPAVHSIGFDGLVTTLFGPLVAGLLAAPFGGNFNKPAAIMTCFALLSIYAMYLGRETRAEPLPR